MTKITLLYKDLFERNSKFLIEHLESIHGFITINFASIVKQNIDENTELGTKANGFIKEGKLVPPTIFQSMIENKIDESNTTKILLINYPKDKEQLELFTKYINTINAKYSEAYYIRTHNVEQNFNKDEKMMKIEEKYKSKEYIIMNACRTQKANESIVSEVQKLTPIIKFDVEAFGTKIHDENEEIIRTIHNKP